MTMSQCDDERRFVAWLVKVGKRSTCVAWMKLADSQPTAVHIKFSHGRTRTAHHGDIAFLNDLRSLADAEIARYASRYAAEAQNSAFSTPHSSSSAEIGRRETDRWTDKQTDYSK